LIPLHPGFSKAAIQVTQGVPVSIEIRLGR
jgi:hypothetical protein